MGIIRKIAGSLDDALDMFLGKGTKSPVEQVLKSHTSSYIHYILTSRQ